MGNRHVTPQQRDEVIAGLRAMAQFLEDNPDIPSPQSVHVQHSFLEPLDTTTWERTPVSDAEKVAYVRAVGDRLGVETEVYEGSVHFQYAVAARTSYTVHAALRNTAQSGDAAPTALAACSDEWQPPHDAGSHPENCRTCSEGSRGTGERSDDGPVSE